MSEKNPTDTELRSMAARLMGMVRSERKAAAVRENGKKGGRPRKTKKAMAKPWYYEND